MGKRSDFKRIGKDKYMTFDSRAVKPLLPHIQHIDRYIEPCAGDGSLIDNLAKHRPGMVCDSAYDIEPGREGIGERDALALGELYKPIITNPPWDRKILHPMIEHFITISPECWLLFDSDWAYTKQSAPYIKHCSHIVAVGRLIWIPGTKMTGKDNVSWYQFEQNPIQTVFTGRP